MKFSYFLAIAVAAQSLWAASLNETMDLSGKFRYRHEWIESESGTDSHRHRMRGSIALLSNLKSGVTLGFGLSTGVPDATSGNQTLTDGFTTKPVGVDLAFFRWQPVSIFKMDGGKTKNPFLSAGNSELIFDGDVRPEGLTASLGGALGAWRSKGVAGGYWLQEHPGDTDDSFLFGFQGALEGRMDGLGAELLLGGGVYPTSGLAGSAGMEGGGKFLGNTALGDSAYSGEFFPVEIFAEFGIPLGGIPFAAFGHVVQNVAEDEENLGWLAGISVGTSKKPGQIALRYTYKIAEANAVLGALADSDFAGGGTDNRGHEANLKIALTSSTSAGASLFINEKGSSGGPSYNRAQLDVNFQF